MPLLRSAILSITGLAALLTLAGEARAQGPWTVTIVPKATPLMAGGCTPVYLQILDASGRTAPRNGAGTLISIADFDMSVTGGAVVGRYTGASAWSACACPASAGVSATITASYPAQSLAQKSRVTGVSFQSSITIPVVAGNSSGVPIGCETLKTTTAPAGGSAPWTVTLVTTLTALPIGSCKAISLDLRDASGKDSPRNPAGTLVSLPDFDMAVTGGGVAGAYSGVWNWSACACQAGAVGSLATITATYPASSLAPAARVPGVAFQSSMRIPLSAAQGTFDPPACSTAAARTVATGVLTPIATAPPPTKTAVTTQPVVVLRAPAPTFVTVTGTPSSATLRWQPIAGVASYVVTRQQGNLPAVEQTLAGTNVGMYDSPLQPATAYSWTIRAIQADGSEGVAVVSFTTPAQPVVAPPTPPTSATARWTSFKPPIHGFQFTNDFVNSAIGPPINFLTHGLCGGMSYAVLDYYNAGRTVPSQDFRPANNTALQQYLYARQVSSLSPNMDRWIELTVNPFGSRTLEFFNWGLDGQLLALKASIDNGRPVNLGVKSLGGGWQGHQVLAIGYDAGRYQGALGAYKEDLKIYIFDPNHPGETVTMVPDVAANEYYYLEHTNDRWRTYFVDGKYFAMTPPAIVKPVYPADGLVHELLFTFITGVDDMRGGADHVDVTVTLADNTTLVFSNISQGGQWVPQYKETAQVVLSTPIVQSAIRTITVSTNATGGVGGDNWDMDRLRVYAVGKDFSNELLTTPAGPYRFTGARIPLVIPVK